MVETVLLDEVHDVRERSATVLLPAMVVSLDVLPARELDRELEVVVMDGSVTSDS